MECRGFGVGGVSGMILLFGGGMLALLRDANMAPAPTIKTQSLTQAPGYIPMSNSFRQYEELAKMARDAFRYTLSYQHVMEQIKKSSVFLTSDRSGVKEAVLAMQHRRELLEPNLGIQRTVEQLYATQEMANQLTQKYSIITSLQTKADCWKSLITPAIEQLNNLTTASAHAASLADSYIAWESSATQLAQRVNEIGLLVQRTHLSARLFAPTEVFTDFATDTLSKINSAENEGQALALETSVHLAEEQLIATTEILDAVIEIPEDDNKVSGKRELQSPYVQRKELLSAIKNEDVEVTASLIDNLPATQAAYLTQKILKTIVICNESGKVLGNQEIFKPTTRALEVYTDMPWLIAIDKKTFAEFIDCLYFLFYEGAGKDKLRFMKKQGGPLEENDFEFILCIKHLRNKWIRHDADHGKEKDIQKSWSALSSQLKWLGLTHLPTTEFDFRSLHMGLLVKACEFLDKIINGLNGN